MNSIGRESCQYLLHNTIKFLFFVPFSMKWNFKTNVSGYQTLKFMTPKNSVLSAASFIFLVVESMKVTESIWILLASKRVEKTVFRNAKNFFLVFTQNITKNGTERHKKTYLSFMLNGKRCGRVVAEIYDQIDLYEHLCCKDNNTQGATFCWASETTCCYMFFMPKVYYFSQLFVVSERCKKMNIFKLDIYLSSTH